MTQINITCDNCGKKIIDTTLSNDNMYNSLSQHKHDLRLQIPDDKKPLDIDNIFVKYNRLRTHYANFCCLECFTTWHEKWTT